MAEGKTLLTLKRSLNACSERCPSRTLELVEASWLLIVIVVIHAKWNLTYTTKQGSRVGCLTQTGFAAFGKGVQLISGPPKMKPTNLVKWYTCHFMMISRQIRNYGGNTNVHSRRAKLIKQRIIISCFKSCLTTLDVFYPLKLTSMERIHKYILSRALLFVKYMPAIKWLLSACLPAAEEDLAIYLFNHRL